MGKAVDDLPRVRDDPLLQDQMALVTGARVGDRPGDRPGVDRPEVAPDRIRVNSISPGAIRTPWTASPGSRRGNTAS